MSWFSVRMCFGTCALWASAWALIDAGYVRHMWGSEEEAEKLRLAYLEDVPTAETNLGEMAQHIIDEAMQVESYHAMDVVVYHTLTPLNFLTALIFGAIVRGQNVLPPLLESSPVPLILRNYEGSAGLPGYPRPKPVQQWDDKEWKGTGCSTLLQESGRERGAWAFSNEIHKGKPLTVDKDGNANLTFYEFLDFPPPLWWRSVPLETIHEGLHRWGFKLQEYKCWPKFRAFGRAVKAAGLKTVAQVADDALSEDKLYEPLSAKAFHDAAKSSALHGVPGVILDHLPAVRSRLLSVNYNMFGNGYTGDHESSWRMLFSGKFKKWGADEGWAGKSPFWDEVFKRQEASSDVRDKVSRQLDAIGQVFDGGSELDAVKAKDLFPDADVNTLERARTLAARERPLNHTSVLLQIAMPAAVADEVMYISHRAGWSPDALPPRPGDADWQQCRFPGGPEEWPQVFLRDVWGVPCSDPQEAKKYFDATSTAARYRVLKHRRAIDLQARLLMTRQASGFEQGAGINMYAHGSLFQHRELTEVIFALAEGVRKTLKHGFDD